MRLFPNVPIVEADGTASRVFRVQWQNTPAPLGKQLVSLVPGVRIVDDEGLPTKDFGLIWRTSRDPALNERLPMVNADGTPSKTFVLLVQTI